MTDVQVLPATGVLCQCGRTFKSFDGWKRHARTCDTAPASPVSINGEPFQTL